MRAGEAIGVATRKSCARARLQAPKHALSALDETLHMLAATQTHAVECGVWILSVEDDQQAALLT